jgi:hypothetical protein
MQRIIVGISGASGAIYGIRALEILRTRAEAEPAESTDDEAAPPAAWKSGGKQKHPTGARDMLDALDE